MKSDNLRHLFSRLALASIFIAFGVWEIVQPSFWSYYVPSFLGTFVPIDTLVILHGSILLVIGLAVLLGVYLRVASAMAALMMLFIIADLVSVSGFSDLVVRDIVVLLLAVSLFFDDTRYLRLTRKG